MLYFEEMRPIFSLLDDAERGQLLTAILDYAENGVPPALSERVSVAWPFVKQKIDRDAKAFRKKCEKATESAKPLELEKDKKSDT